MSADDAQNAVESAWSTDGGVLACFTERTGFDLLLAASAFPPGGEVLVSAVTIDDMARIVRQHGLVPVPVDIRESDMSPRIDSLEAARTSKTIAILVAHLFGGRFEMDGLTQWAHSHGLHVWEDCAQAYEGPSYRGGPESDVVMFSFGPIKTNTALGGGLMCVRDRPLLESMRHLQRTYPIQSRWSFLKRVLNYAIIKAVEGPRRFQSLISLCRLLGIDYDHMLNAAVRNLPGDDFIDSVRKRPSAPLLQLMARRLRTFRTAELDERRRKGEFLAGFLRGTLQCPGADAAEHSFWVFPVCVADREHAVLSLREAGFDATMGSALRVISSPVDQPQLAAVEARQVLESAIFVPLYREMSYEAIERLGTILLEQRRACVRSVAEAAHS